ncbi:hypothetical protein PENSPDRAFT_333049 [Peniophora sp. CONT]|nr:hypothetical protein PENSPDRAFT_333049 [Peniophora sp. CONT]
MSNESLILNGTLNYTVSMNTTDGESRPYAAGFTHFPSSLGERSAIIVINSAIFMVVSRQAYIYIERGGKGSAFRTILCLWLLSAMHFLSKCSALFAVHQFSLVEVEPGTSSKLYTMTGRSKLYASLVTLVVWIQAICLSIPGLATCSVLTHALATTQIGLNGTAHALTTPQDESSSDCPRLRLPSRLRTYAPSPHSSRRQKYLAAVLMCAANLIILYVLCKASGWVQNLLPGAVMSKPYVRFSDVYTIVYLGIKTRHAAIGSGGSARDERERQAHVDTIEMPPLARSESQSAAM